MCRQIYKLDISETKCEQSKDEHARLVARAIDDMGNGVIWVDMDEEITSAKETYYA